MFFTAFASSIEDLQVCRACAVKEVLLEPAALARQGRLDRARTERLAEEARGLALEPVLVWDILMTDDRLLRLTEEIAAWDLTLFSAVRVHDLGAAQWLRRCHAGTPLQLLADVGSGNLEALLGWCDHFDRQLVRLILSNELPEETLRSFISALPVPCEVLGAGPVEIFYSPRPLLSGCLPNTPPLAVVCTAAGSDLPPFRAVETGHGTFLFLDRDRYILGRLSGLIDAGLAAARIDLRPYSRAGRSAEGIDAVLKAVNEGRQAAAEVWPHSAAPLGFEANDAAASISELRPERLARRDDALAELVSFDKGRYTAFLVLKDFSAPDASRLWVPGGAWLELSELEFRGLEGKTLDLCRGGQVIWTRWMEGLSCGALLF